MANENLTSSIHYHVHTQLSKRLDTLPADATTDVIESALREFKANDRILVLDPGYVNILIAHGRSAFLAGLAVWPGYDQWEETLEALSDQAVSLDFLTTMLYEIERVDSQRAWVIACSDRMVGLLGRANYQRNEKAARQYAAWIVRHGGELVLERMFGFYKPARSKLIEERREFYGQFGGEPITPEPNDEDQADKNDEDLEQE